MSLCKAPLDRRRLLVASLAALALPLNTAAAVMEGQRFADTIVLGDTALRLNGLGLRAVAWLKGYIAALYLAQPARTAQAAVAAGGPKRLSLRMLQEAPTTEFTKAIDKGVRRNTPAAEQAALAARVAQWRQAVLDIGRVRPGDTVDLDYLPGSGMTMRYNGAVRGPVIPGEDFFAAVLRIFLGERPADPRLKAGLLGTALE